MLHIRRQTVDYSKYKIELLQVHREYVVYGEYTTVPITFITELTMGFFATLVGALVSKYSEECNYVLSFVVYNTLL